MGRRKSTPEHPNGYDRDHLLYYRADWEARADNKRLRRIQWLIPPLDRDVHEAKHREIAFVPVLGRFVASKVYRDYLPIKGDYIASLDSLVGTISEATLDLRLPSDERSYAEATIDALQRQRPYIVEGLVPNETRVA